MAQGNYERELKNIMMGNKERIEGVTKTCSDDIQKKYMEFHHNPFLVNRGAGSLGIDLMAMRNDDNFVIEVKSSKDDTIYITNTDRLEEQYQKMNEIKFKYSIIPLYAFRLKNKRGERWKFYTLDEDFDIPQPDETNQGNFNLKWERGMILSDFINYYYYERDNIAED